MEEASRGSLDDTKTITLEVDADDWRDIEKAIADGGREEVESE